jgi:hypothetical protein
MGLTLFVLVLSVRDTLHPQHLRGLLLPMGPGWLRLLTNVGFYGYLCWLAFWLIRGTHGRERLVMVGWFTAILLAPLEMFQPTFTLLMRYIETFALLAAVAIFAQLAPTARLNGPPHLP